MPDITVHRHGDRWAVAEPGAESPTKEFPTREAAELAARDLAAGGSVQVIEEDPTSLEHVEHVEPGDAGAPAGGDAREPGGVGAEEGVRERQAGL
jgi:hypothetical protein